MGSQAHILFVCTANMCRSPMAEYLLRARLPRGARVSVSSAGVVAAANARATAEAVQVMAEKNIDMSGHRSRNLTPELVRSATLIVTMTRAHRDMIMRTYPEAADRVRLLTEFGSSPTPSDLEDPIGSPVEVYRKTRDEIDRALSDLIVYLAERGYIESVPANVPARTMKIALGADHAGFAIKEAIKTALEKKATSVTDFGAFSDASVDYPDYAIEVAQRVSAGEMDFGILVCATGVGMCIAANKFPRVRAALCSDVETARLSRQHNDANILCLPGRSLSPEQAVAITEAWLETQFEGGRHERRVRKISALEAKLNDLAAIYETDVEMHGVFQREARRQRENLELIASENYASPAVRAAQGSILTNKYAEGYPGKRWYHGCEHVDEAERLAIERAKQLFGAEHVNVQPHSGSQANMAVYFAVMKPGDTMLAMSLACGGHLTHGHKVNFSGRFFNVVHYGVNRETEQIDYDEVEALAREHRPRLLCAGASAYSRIIDFARLRRIADAVGAYLMVDMAHIAGLVAAGCHPSPVPYSDFVTSTTHKTLRGPRGGLILCRAQFAQEIDRQVFPGIQGGPLMHVIAAKAVCFLEALQPEFKLYQEQIVRNAKALAQTLAQKGLRIVSGGTDNHMMLVDLTPMGLTGKEAAEVLDRAGITVNKNAIPFDTRSPFLTSGIRLGTPAVTTRGMKEPEMEQIGALIHRVLTAKDQAEVIEAVRREVHALTARFPVP